MVIANIVSYILVLLGAVNWGMYGIFNFNLVSAIFMGDRSVGAIIAYVIIALAAIWLILSTIFSGGILRFRANQTRKSERITALPCGGKGTEKVRSLSVFLCGKGEKVSEEFNRNLTAIALTNGTQEHIIEVKLVSNSNCF